MASQGHQAAVAKREKQMNLLKVVMEELNGEQRLAPFSLAAPWIQIVFEFDDCYHHLQMPRSACLLCGKEHWIQNDAGESLLTEEVVADIKSCYNNKAAQEHLVRNLFPTTSHGFGNGSKAHVKKAKWIYDPDYNTDASTKNQCIEEIKNARDKLVADNPSVYEMDKDDDEKSESEASSVFEENDNYDDTDGDTSDSDCGEWVKQQPKNKNRIQGYSKEEVC